jgi:hypothetical protein
MMQPAPRKAARCAIYTRKSTEHNLDLEFNSLDAQREACEAYIKSQAHEGWRLIRTRYDDGACRAPPWIALPYRSFWMTCGPGRSTSLSSTRSTG